MGSSFEVFLAGQVLRNPVGVGHLSALSQGSRQSPGTLGFVT